MEAYISKAGESSFKRGCPCGNITNWINSQSVRKNAISPATRATPLFRRGTSGVASISAIKAIIVIDEPYKNFSVADTIR